MATFLFDSIIFGPVKSRRLGVSLGINLLPDDGKICSFDCIYCECGLNGERKPSKNNFPLAHDVDVRLRSKLLELAEEGTMPDVITFAGNGEPTLHPEFKLIIQNTLRTKDELCPKAQVTVLSNSTRIWDQDVISALRLVDNNILKLDSALEETVSIMNRPNGLFSIKECIHQLRQFEGNAIIQTLFCKGVVNGRKFDNTTMPELEALANAYLTIEPRKVMIYSISRDTPFNTIEKIGQEELQAIGTFFRGRSVKVEIS